MKLGSIRGQGTGMRLRQRDGNPHEFRSHEGQVGQESHLRLAVLGMAALCSIAFRSVPEQAGKRPFWWRKVRGRSPTFTGVGVKSGSRSSSVAYGRGIKSA
jgi:hypothetical protein